LNRAQKNAADFRGANTIFTNGDFIRVKYGFLDSKWKARIRRAGGRPRSPLAGYERRTEGAHTMLKTATLGIAVISLLLSAATRAQQNTNDIVETAIAAGSFKTLAKALQAADLVDTLKGQGPFTVFAPTDEAFAKLPAGTLNDLLKPENKQKLQRILSYHVVPGRVSSTDVVKLRTAKAVSGDTIDITASGGTVRVENARVVKTDIQASNGVIHVIDTVIIPDSTK
jgi:uncharacterized surface protein with fasciclin (FAS1) repeats